MRSIFNYTWRTISFLLLLGMFSTAEAKEKNEENTEKVFNGLYVDVDILHPILHLFNSNRMGLNADVQIDLWHKLYPTILVGYDWFDASSEYSYPIPANNNQYKINGMYFKIGALYNIWKKNYEKQNSPIAYLGINYGISPGFHYTIENYPINNSYWDNGNDRSFSANGHTIAQWGEIVGGVKTPIVKNFCLGFEVMFKTLLHIKDQNSDNNIIHQSYAPGFGDKEAGKWGFRYTISYFFHL